MRRSCLWALGKIATLRACADRAPSSVRQEPPPFGMVLPFGGAREPQVKVPRSFLDGPEEPEALQPISSNPEPQSLALEPEPESQTTIFLQEKLTSIRLFKAWDKVGWVCLELVLPAICFWVRTGTPLGRLVTSQIRCSTPKVHIGRCLSPQTRP